MPAGEALLALRDLRRRRRRRHLAQIDVWDALYKLYVVATFGSFGLAVLLGYTAGAHLSGERLIAVERHGAAVVGLAIAAAIAVGLRSGARGGPLTLEAADVLLVLLSPIDRRTALLGPALRQLRFGVFVGTLSGAIAGQLASRRLPGGWLAWLGAGAATGAAGAAAAIGAALIAAGLRVGRWATVAAGLLVAWSVADLMGETATAPTTLLGEVALVPLRHTASFLGIPFAVGLAVVGLGLLGRLAIVQAQERTALLAQFRFALTMQDVRTVVLLRRLLAQEGARSRPWFRLRIGTAHPVWRRDGQGVLRWPAGRIGRLVLMNALAGTVLVAAWRGATALIAAAGVALLFAALDSIEGLAQEWDHPVRRDTLPVERHWLTGQHLVVPVLLGVAAGVAAVLAALALVPDRPGLVLGVGASTGLSAALAAVCAAALSVIAEPVDPLSADVVYVPELVASARFLVRVCAAPALAIIGLAPVLAARSQLESGHWLAASAAVAGVTVVVLLTAVRLLLPGPRRAAP